MRAAQSSDVWLVGVSSRSLPDDATARSVSFDVCAEQFSPCRCTGAADGNCGVFPCM